MILPNSHRKHYKGNEYKVLTLAKHSETGEEMVVYQDVSLPEKVWTRPMTMFLERIVLDGENKERFTLIS